MGSRSGEVMIKKLDDREGKCVRKDCMCTAYFPGGELDFPNCFDGSHGFPGLQFDGLFHCFLRVVFPIFQVGSDGSLWLSETF